MSMGRIVVGFVVFAVFIFLLAPIVFVVGASFGRSALLTFPPTGLTLEWYGRISPGFLERSAAAMRCSSRAASSAAMPKMRLNPTAKSANRTASASNTARLPDVW